ncbi:hypothetical protein FG379_002408 [Cryptosporidium bovis]|uniref:uncharacterized protein n=1 Tax=Cryptosporidium bovis TaxID=310047 RepID=UPI00351A7A7F|nr:hypothetical protein FG379_002408 [Cryptosporidium bovis]
MTKHKNVNGDMGLLLSNNDLSFDEKKLKCLNAEKNDLCKIGREFSEKFFTVNNVEAENTALINNIYPYRSSDFLHSQCLYSATGNNQITDYLAHAVQKREFENSLEIKTNSDDINAENVDFCKKMAKGIEEKLDISKYNSVIKEDKVKRKVILEWYRNNELFSKQWSCKKFGKEGAAKRAIQFLEKIHGISVKCFPGGYYSTLIEIGSLKDKNQDPKKQHVLFHTKEKRKYKKRLKTETMIYENSNDNNNTNTYDEPHLKNENYLNEEHALLIQRMMLFFLSVDIDNAHNNCNLIKEKCKVIKNDGGQLRNNLHLNCRKLFRNVYQELLSSQNFYCNYKYNYQTTEYQNDPTQVRLSLYKDDNNIDYLNSNNQTNCYSYCNSLVGIRNVKDILQKTTRRDIQINNSIEDIKKIISTSENNSNNDPDNTIDHFLWEELIKNGSRINDDLQYLSEGGLPGNTSVCLSKYGDGNFRFNRCGILSCSNDEQLEDLFKLIDHNRSCLNLIHIEIERNGTKIMPRFEKRITRLQGKFNGHNNHVYDEKNAINSNCDNLVDDNLEMENAIYTLLDMRYGLNNLRSKDVLIDLIDINENINSQANELSRVNVVHTKKRKINSNNILDESGGNILKDRKNKIIKKDSEIESNYDVSEYSKSTLEWWKKPRGWKVSYYRGKQKYSQIFKVSLNSTSSERESQYKLAYEFFLSTKNKELPYTNENTNTQNVTTSNIDQLNVGPDRISDNSMVKFNTNNNNNNTEKNYCNNGLPFLFNYMSIPQFNGNVIPPFNYCMSFLGYSPQLGIGTQSFCNQLNNNENTSNNIVNMMDSQNTNISLIQQNSGSLLYNSTASNNKSSTTAPLSFNPHLFQPFFSPLFANINYQNMLMNNINLNSYQNVNFDANNGGAYPSNAGVNIDLNSNLDIGQV